MTHEELVRIEAQLMYFSQHVSRAVADIKEKEFDLEDPEFLDWQGAVRWVTKLDGFAKRGGKPAPGRKATPPAREPASSTPGANVAQTVCDDDDDERTLLVDELGF